MSMQTHPTVMREGGWSCGTMSKDGSITDGCGKLFTHRGALTSHRKTCPKRFVCGCGLSFSSDAALCGHRRACDSGKKAACVVSRSVPKLLELRALLKEPAIQSGPNDHTVVQPCDSRLRCRAESSSRSNDMINEGAGPRSPCGTDAAAACESTHQPSSSHRTAHGNADAATRSRRPTLKAKMLASDAFAQELLRKSGEAVLGKKIAEHAIECIDDAPFTAYLQSLNATRVRTRAEVTVRKVHSDVLSFFNIKCLHEEDKNQLTKDDSHTRHPIDVCLLVYRRAVEGARAHSSTNSLQHAQQHERTLRALLDFSSFLHDKWPIKMAGLQEHTDSLQLLKDAAASQRSEAQRLTPMIARRSVSGSAAAARELRNTTARDLKGALAKEMQVGSCPQQHPNLLR